MQYRFFFLQICNVSDTECYAQQLQLHREKGSEAERESERMGHSLHILLPGSIFKCFKLNLSLFIL